MIRTRIKIEDGIVEDFYDKFGFIYMDGDERTAADEKEDAVSSYAEEAGEHRDGRTVDAPFDYTAKFIIEAPLKNLDNVNVKIHAFNSAIREQLPDSDLKRKKEITFYNLRNRCKIVGYPEIVAQPTECYHSCNAGVLDCAEVELKIRVSDPRKCDFAYHPNFIGEFAENSTVDDWYWFPNGKKEAIPVDPVTKQFAYDWEGTLTYAEYLFCGTTDGRSKIKRIECLPPLENISGPLYYMFSNMIEVEELPQTISIPNADSQYYVFLNDRKLSHIGVFDCPKAENMEMIINTGGTTLKKVESINAGATLISHDSDFLHCSAASLYLKNFGKSQLTEWFVTAPNWGDDAIVAGARDSMIRTLLKDSHDRAGAGLAVCTVVLHPNALARLTQDEIKAITDKGYNLTAKDI